MSNISTIENNYVMASNEYSKKKQETLALLEINKQNKSYVWMFNYPFLKSNINGLLLYKLAYSYNPIAVDFPYPFYGNLDLARNFVLSQKLEDKKAEMACYMLFINYQILKDGILNDEMKF